MKVIEASILLIVMFGVVGTLAWSLLFRPDGYVKFNSRLLRLVYKDLFRLSDETLDKMGGLSPTQFIVGSLSTFINRGTEHPGEFPRVLGSIRLMGCLILAMLLLTLMLLAYAILSGKPITINLP